VLPAQVTPDWLHGRASFGGIQGAFGAVAMRAVVGDALPLRALQVTFVMAVGEGPAHAEASLIRQGRAVTHAQCRLFSNGRLAATMVGLYGAARESRAQIDMLMPDDIKPVDAIANAPFVPGKMPDFLRHFDQRWAGGTRLYSATAPKPSRMWARLHAGEEQGPLAAATLAEASLTAIADLPPPPALSMLDGFAPGASLTWLLEFAVDPRTVDPATWLLMQTEARYAGEGYSSQTARIWDSTGRAIAVSHQTTALFG
jgi:acyl-CoA thioesterase